MPDPRNIEDRIGLDYLVKAGRLPPPAESSAPAYASSPSPSAPSYGDTVLQALAARAVLQAVHELEGTPRSEKGVRLAEVSPRVGMAAELLLPLTRRLEAADLLRTVEPDAFGNHLVTLTARAPTFLSVDKQPDLIRLLGVE